MQIGGDAGSPRRRAAMSPQTPISHPGVPSTTAMGKATIVWSRIAASSAQTRSDSGEPHTAPARNSPTIAAMAAAAPRTTRATLAAVLATGSPATIFASSETKTA